MRPRQYATAAHSRGWREALRYDDALAQGLNIHAGAITCPPVAESHNLPLADLAEVLA